MALASRSTPTRFFPRGLIGNSGKILGCRALTLLHDDQGHPLRASKDRGDLHLTNGIPQVLTYYEQATEALHLVSLVVDREAMAAGALFTTEHGGSHSDHHPEARTNIADSTPSPTLVRSCLSQWIGKARCFVRSLLLSFCWLVLMATMNRSDSRWRCSVTCAERCPARPLKRTFHAPGGPTSDMKRWPGG